MVYLQVDTGEFHDREKKTPPPVLPHEDGRHQNASRRAEDRHGILLNSLSVGGAFISSEDLSVFDLEEEFAIVIEDAEDRFYEGRARVVRSSRVFSPEHKLTQSGYGLMFIDAPPEYLTRIDRHVAKHNQVIL